MSTSRVSTVIAWAKDLGLEGLAIWLVWAIVLIGVALYLLCEVHL